MSKSNSAVTVKKEQEEMVAVCQYLRGETMRGFDDLQKLKDSGGITEADLDYELARDRKAAIALKTIIVELGVEKVNSRRISTTKPDKTE